MAVTAADGRKLDADTPSFSPLPPSPMTEHASSSMMGAEGFGSESFNKEEDVVAQEKSNGSFIQGIMKK